MERAEAKFLVAVIPSELQIEGNPSGQAAQVAQILEMSLLNPPFEDQVEAHVVAVCEWNGIPVVDVRSRLEAAFAGIDQVLYYEVDCISMSRGTVSAMKLCSKDCDSAAVDGSGSRFVV